MGVCLGSHLAFRAAINPRILAASCFYATDIHSGGVIPAQPGKETRTLAGQIKARCKWSGANKTHTYPQPPARRGLSTAEPT